MSFADQFGDWIRGNLHNLWLWFNQLNYQEWFLVLGIVAGVGFLCMRGFGSRSNY